MSQHHVKHQALTLIFTTFDMINWGGVLFVWKVRKRLDMGWRRNKAPFCCEAVDFRGSLGSTGLLSRNAAGAEALFRFIKGSSKDLLINLPPPPDLLHEIKQFFFLLRREPVQDLRFYYPTQSEKLNIMDKITLGRQTEYIFFLAIPTTLTWIPD